VLLCDGKSQILEETILYAALDVFAKCLGSKFSGQGSPERFCHHDSQNEGRRNDETRAGPCLAEKQVKTDKGRWTLGKPEVGRLAKGGEVTGLNSQGCTSRRVDGEGWSDAG
jgi:hypothetical protein